MAVESALVLIRGVYRWRKKEEEEAARGERKGKDETKGKRDRGGGGQVGWIGWKVGARRKNHTYRVSKLRY